MIPLSCVNCCHNPLQIGPLGTAFGFCTRHRSVLNHPEATTCGQLLRKDLLEASATREAAIHATIYAPNHITLVVDPAGSAKALKLVEKANGQLPPDAVVDEVQNYGLVGSKITTMAALRHVPGTRAEVAMLSLSRSYFRNCVRQGGPWTSGVHLLYWVLGRLEETPGIEATDLRGPITSLEETIAVAQWLVIAFRLAFVADVSRRARVERDKVGALSGLAERAAASAAPDRPDRLLSFLHKHRHEWRKALPVARYQEIKEALHEDEEANRGD